MQALVQAAGISSHKLRLARHLWQSSLRFEIRCRATGCGFDSRALRLEPLSATVALFLPSSASVKTCGKSSSGVLPSLQSAFHPPPLPTISHVLASNCPRIRPRRAFPPLLVVPSVPVACIASGVRSWGVRPGRLSNAPVRSCSRAWAYRPMVSVGVECRANSWQVLTDAPPPTMPLIKVCHREKLLTARR